MTLMNIRTRIALNRLSQEQVAREASFDPTVFSRILRGLRPEPAEQRVLDEARREARRSGRSGCPVPA